MVYGPPTRTVGEVMRAVKRTFGDESQAQLEDDDIVAWINDAQDEINNLNKVLKEQSTVTAVAGEPTYSFPSKRIQQIEALLYAGVKVSNVTYAQALENYVGIDRGSSPSPDVWFEWGGKFTFSPTPSTAEAITLIYTVRPQPVNKTSTTVLSLPDKYYQDIVRYVLQQAYLMDEALDLSSSQAQQMATSLENKSEEERSAQQMTYSTITFID